MKNRFLKLEVVLGDHLFFDANENQIFDDLNGVVSAYKNLSKTA